MNCLITNAILLELTTIDNKLQLISSKLLTDRTEKLIIYIKNELFEFFTWTFMNVNWHVSVVEIERQ